MRKVVGIDRKIKRAWVDAVLDRLAQDFPDEGSELLFSGQALEGRTARQRI